ncbi:hypothetical protein DICA3_E13278 [Diutina catenulata]
MFYLYVLGHHGDSLAAQLVAQILELVLVEAAPDDESAHQGVQDKVDPGVALACSQRGEPELVEPAALHSDLKHLSAPTDGHAHRVVVGGGVVDCYPVASTKKYHVTP